MFFYEKNILSVLAEGYLDLTFRNAFWDNNKLYWFDQEWMLENIPAKYILFRAVGTLYYSFPDLEDILPLTELYERYGICDIVKQFSQLEDFFNKSIISFSFLPSGIFALSIYYIGFNLKIHIL